MGLLIVNPSKVSSGDVAASDIAAGIASVFIGSRLGVLETIVGAKTGQFLSIKLNLEDLDLKDFSSVKDQLEPYRAKLIK